MVQNYARRRKIPIDHLELDFQFTDIESNNFDDSTEEIAPDSVYIHGLYMQGARWCRQTRLIQESQPRIIFDSLPVILLKPLEKKDSVSDRVSVYRCPVYKTSIRQGVISATGHSTNYVVEIYIPIDRDELHWIVRSKYF